MFGIGFSEILLVVMLLIIFLGANRLPELGRSLGEAMREMRKRDDDNEGGEAESIEETPR